MRCLAVLCSVIVATNASALITGDEGGHFSVVGEASNFVNWATNNFAVSVEAGQTMLQTIYATDKQYHYTTCPINDTQADLDILFTFAKPLQTCRLDYGSVTDVSQTLGAWVQLEVTAKGIKTLIYLHTHKNVDGDYNYTSTGGIPDGIHGDAERHRAYTIIDPLVAGETEFTLNIAVYRGGNGIDTPGDQRGLHYGGSFLPDREVPGYWPESDFILSGTMIKVPAGLVFILH